MTIKICFRSLEAKEILVIMWMVNDTEDLSVIEGVLLAPQFIDNDYENEVERVCLYL